MPKSNLKLVVFELLTLYIIDNKYMTGLNVLNINELFVNVSNLY